GPASRYAFAIPLKACPRIRFGQIGCREPPRFSPRSGRARVDCACGLVHTLETPAMGHSRPAEGPPGAGACPLRSERGRALASLDMSAKCQKAAQCTAAKRCLFDHLVGACEQRHAYPPSPAHSKAAGTAIRLH